MSIINHLRDAIDSIKVIDELNFLRRLLRVHTEHLSRCIDDMDLYKGNPVSISRFESAINDCAAVLKELPNKISLQNPQTKTLVDFVAEDYCKKLEIYRDFKKKPLPSRFGWKPLIGAVLIISICAGVGSVYMEKASI